MKRITVLILIITVAISCINTFAIAGEITLETKIERISDGVTGDVSQIIKVYGTAVDKYVNKKITVAIIRPDVDLNDTSITDEEKLAYVSMDYVGKDNNYSFEIPFNEESETYEIRIMADELNEPVTTPLFVPSITNISNLIKNLKEKIITAEELDNEILTNYIDLGIDISVYSKLVKDVRIDICEDIMAKFTVYTIENFEKLFYESTMYFGLNFVKDSGLYEFILECYKDTLKLHENPYYTNFTSLENKEAVYGYMMKKSDYTLISDVSKEFFDAVCCYSFKALASFTNFEGCFDVFDSYMDIEDYFNTFVNSEYKDDIASYVTELLEEKSSLQEIIELIKNTIDNAATLFYKPEPVIPQKPIVTVGGGGGGGSASNKVVISEDIIKEEIQDQKVEEIIKDVFTDVDSEHWAKDSIAILYAKGIISGRTKDSFAPEANVTRAEFVKLVSEALDLTDNNAECDFNDVSPDDWSYKYIASLKNNGFINGISESEFGASNSITRQDAATIIYNCIKSILDKTGNGTKFSDAQSISEYATEAVGKLCKIGVISGFPDGSFAPTQNITRAQSAQIIYNLLNYKGGI